MDQMLADAARSLSSAIGGRWGGWHAVHAEALPDGPGGLVVKHLVQAMKGQVRVASQVGRGTTFRVRLPRAG